MEPKTLIELFGYLGSVLVVVSMLMSSVVKLRILNTVGSVISGAYALIIGSFPLALMNICLIAINVYNLRKLLLDKKQYHLVRCGSREALVSYFLQYYSADIQVYFPEFQGVTDAMDAAYMVLSDGDPAGILLAQTKGPGVLQVFLEYTTPTYRDCSIGQFLCEALPDLGVATLYVTEASQTHLPYLEKMGYARTDSGFTKHLK